MLDQYKYAASMVIYNPLNGSMKWKREEETDRYSKRWNSQHAGRECRSRDSDGYIEIYKKKNGKTLFRVRAHRLAWFIVYGKEPDFEIDHINQNKTDNRIENLRDVPRFLNCRNKPKSKANSSGVTGVYWHKSVNKWAACVVMLNKNKHIGVFEDIKDAEAAVKAFRAQNEFTELHGQ